MATLAANDLDVSLDNDVVLGVQNLLELFDHTGDPGDAAMAARLRGVLGKVIPGPLMGLVADHHVRYVTPEGEASNDGLSWQSATTLDAALEEHRSELIRISPGLFHRTTGGVFPNSDPVPSIQGAGPFATRIVWDTDGGTCLRTQTVGTHYLRGLRFQPGTGKPDCWYDASSDTAQDYGDDITDCMFGDWNTTTGEAAIKLGGTVNVFLNRVRFAGGKGPAIIAKGYSGSINIDQFTVDSINAEGQFEGLLRIDYTQGQRMTVRIASGRVEATGVDYADPKALVHLTSGNGIPLSLLLENIQVDLGNISQDHVLFHNSGTGYPNLTVNADPDTAVTFNGTTQYVNIGVLTGSPQILTVEFWFQMTTDLSAASSGLVPLTIQGGFTGIYLGQASGSIANEIVSVINAAVNSRSYWAHASDVIAKDVPHHVVCVWSAGDVEWKIYVDGVSKTISKTGTPEVFVGTAVNIARRAGDANLRFGGILDEIAVYDAVLSEAQIVNHYDIGVSGVPIEVARRVIRSPRYGITRSANR